MAFRRFALFASLAVLIGGAAVFVTRDKRTGSSENFTNATTPAITVKRPPDITLPATVSAAMQASISEVHNGAVTAKTAQALVSSRDPGIGWVLSDLVRFSDPELARPLYAAFGELFRENANAKAVSDWQSMTDFLIAQDVPAPPRYRGFKAELFLTIDRRWEGIFTDFDSDIDWRFLSWGGVFSDRRAFGDREECSGGCIPANDDPPLTAASEGGWYPDDRIVFGVTIGNESVAFPKNIMEVHEMVNITIGGKRLGIPYCTLCGSAQAFVTDQVLDTDRPLVLRTSGLLYLSNKVMYDLDSGSAFDTFNGRAVTGQLHLDNVTLPMETTVTTTWAKWKQAHPQTKIVAQDGGWGQKYPLDPLNGRDDDGPIFPIRRSDTRLAVQAQVVGVKLPDGTAIAFPVDQLNKALAAGKSVSQHGVSIVADGGGFRAQQNGTDLPTHQAFWFAWAQFNPGTELWSLSAK